MNRRHFLKILSSIPILAAVPAIAKSGADIDPISPLVFRGAQTKEIYGRSSIDVAFIRQFQKEVVEACLKRNSKLSTALSKKTVTF